MADIKPSEMDSAQNGDVSFIKEKSTIVYVLAGVAAATGNMLTLTPLLLALGYKMSQCDGSKSMGNQRRKAEDVKFMMLANIWCAGCVIPISIMFLMIFVVMNGNMGFKENGMIQLEAPAAEYELVKTPKNHNDAIADCEAKGMTMGNVPTAAAHEVMANLDIPFSPLGDLSAQIAWVGAHDKDGDGKFNNADSGNTPLSYKSWCPDNPKMNGTCACLTAGKMEMQGIPHRPFSSCWFDIPCFIPLPYVCKKGDMTSSFYIHESEQMWAGDGHIQWFSLAKGNSKMAKVNIQDGLWKIDGDEEGRCFTVGVTHQWARVAAFPCGPMSNSRQQFKYDADKHVIRSTLNETLVWGLFPSPYDANLAVLSLVPEDSLKQIIFKDGSAEIAMTMSTYALITLILAISTIALCIGIIVFMIMQKGKVSEFLEANAATSSITIADMARGSEL